MIYCYGGRDLGKLSGGCSMLHFLDLALLRPVLRGCLRILAAMQSFGLKTQAWV